MGDPVGTAHRLRHQQRILRDLQLRLKVQALSHKPFQVEQIPPDYAGFDAPCRTKKLGSFQAEIVRATAVPPRRAITVADFNSAGDPVGPRLDRDSMQFPKAVFREQVVRIQEKEPFPCGRRQAPVTGSRDPTVALMNDGQT